MTFKKKKKGGGNRKLFLVHKDKFCNSTCVVKSDVYSQLKFCPNKNIIWRLISVSNFIKNITVPVGHAPYNIV